MTYEEALRRVKEREKFEDLEILKLANDTGYTIAHSQANRGWTTEDLDILRLADAYGRTVAHRQASRGWTTEDLDIIRLADEDGWTVAHRQAWNGWEPKTREAKIYVLTERLKE